MTTMHFASIFERLADLMPDAPAITCGDVTRSWSEYEQRAARVAGHLAAAGLGKDSKVGLYLHNGNPYLEAHYGILKLRGVPVNVNYRYEEEELRYLLHDSDCDALVFQACYTPRVAAIRHRLPRIRTFIRVADDSGLSLPGDVDYAQVQRDAAPMPPIPRSEDDPFMIYTGGTTGMPKGVVYAVGAMTRQLTSGWVRLVGRTAPPDTAEAVAQAAAELHRAGEQRVSLAAPPLMHGSGMFGGTLLPHLTGAKVVTIDRLGLDAAQVWREVQRHGVHYLAIVGDAFARPLVAELDRARSAGTPYDLDSLRVVFSSGVMWSARMKQRLLEYGDLQLIDGVGSSEGSMASSITTRNSPVETATFQLNANVRVLDADDRDVVPGSGAAGLIALTGNVPIGYYKDPERSARTFRTIDGVRYSFPGDAATVNADGTITLLGRGSRCINTGGEKVFPEEVEEAVKSLPDVEDCLVVGVPDERFGHRVAAVVSLRAGAQMDATAVLQALRGKLAGYKLPRGVVFVPEVQRGLNGKADYPWAERTARSQLAT